MLSLCRQSCANRKAFGLLIVGSSMSINVIATTHTHHKYSDTQPVQSPNPAGLSKFGVRSLSLRYTMPVDSSPSSAKVHRPIRN